MRSNSKIQNFENWESYNIYRTYCKETSWIYSLIPSNGYISTLSPANEGNIYSIYEDTASISYYSASGKGSYVFPVFYLSSDITLSGTGSSVDPYIITITN